MKYSSGGQKSGTKVVVSGPDSLQESQERVFVTLLQCLVASGCPCIVAIYTQSASVYTASPLLCVFSSVPGKDAHHWM